jgi:catechol 2,3-dioxygenase-like lactoylglutathione lyase family enzyme
MPIAGFDHVALPTDRPEEMIEIYERLGFQVPDLEEWKASRLPFFSVFFAGNRINFHTPAMWKNEAFALRGPTARPGCGDLCFVWEGGSQALHAMLEKAGAEIVAGPIELQGGRAQPGTSLYLRDPDLNLLEFIVYDG